MQTNLDKFYKNSEAYETKGIWFDISNDLGFHIKRFGGFNSPAIKLALAKYYKPYSRQVEAGTLSLEKEKEIHTKVFVESCVIGWKGVEIDGKIAEFSQDLALKFFLSLPELTESLIAYATDAKNYREDLGNS